MAAACARPSVRVSPPALNHRRFPSPAFSIRGAAARDRRRFGPLRCSAGDEVNTTLNYTEDQQEIGEPVKLYPASEQVDGKRRTEMLDNPDIRQRRKGAKIHDFCLGIPFGGIVFGGGLFGFLFSKTPATSMLSGAAILAMGFISLKVWRQGKSSLPLILGQAAVAATLFWKHLRLYPVTKKVFPSGFYVVTSAAMLCFYSYVLIAGGNPPPKKKLAASPSS